MSLRFSGFLIFVFAITLCGGIPAWAFPGSDGFSSPEMVMDAWSRAIRQRDTEMFASCYWGNARQLIVTAEGSRWNVRGVNAIAEGFHDLLAEHSADTTGFWLPVPLRYEDPEEKALQFIYRDRTYPAINMMQFEERDGLWAVGEQHIYWRNLSAYVPGPSQRRYDTDRDGILDPAEQSAMVEAYWLVTTGRHGVITPVDEEFDFNDDGYLSATESRRARSVLFRDRLRSLPTIYPEFAAQYLTTNANGETTIHAANAVLRDFIDSETAIRPGRVQDEPAHAIADFDGDGWLGPDEISAYAEMIVRVLAAIPEPPCFSREIDGSTEEIVSWTDANSDGVVSDTELNDLGYLVFAALSGDPVVTSAPLCRFDQNRDFLLSLPEQDALRAYFAIELLPQTVSRLGETYPTVLLLDTDGTGDLNRIEISSAMELIASPRESVGSRINSPLDQVMDRKPEDEYLSEWEVWSVVSDVLAASSRQWIESRLTDSTMVQFERKTGVSRAESDDEDLSLQSNTAPTIASEMSVFQRLARTAGRSDPGSVASDDTSDIEELTMPAGAVGDGVVRLAARLDPVFPVMYKWYADQHIGYAYIENTSSEAITDIIARVNIPRLVDSAIDSAIIPSAEPQEVIRIAIPALLNETAVLAITEGRTAAATVEVEYTAGAGRQTISRTVQLEFYDRNAITWDDDRKASAFVTARDDQVMLFSGNLHASMYAEFRVGLSRELQLAMLMFDGLAEHGMVYRTDPSSPYADYSHDQLAVDYLQFPRQTLVFRNGDCDDLSVTYAALLEAVGIPAAFITTPGHIFVGVGLNTTEDEARRTFLFPDDIIYTDSGDVWLPVEVTALRGTFLEAWSIAARQWRDAIRHDGSRGDEARVIPVRSAWQEYAPVGFSGFTFPLSAPDSPRVVERCLTELTQFVAREIADREAAFLGRLEADPSDHELRNRLGTLYARYGLMDKATAQFEQIADQADFYPALLNLGNTTYLAGDYPEAVGYYERALTMEPESGLAMLGVARASLEVEDYPRVREAYDRLKVVSPGLASEHSYLESRGSTSSRAGDTSGRSAAVMWMDEP